MRTHGSKYWTVVVMAALLLECSDRRSGSSPPNGESVLPVVLAPDAPTDLVVVAVNAGQANLSWTDNSADELEFRVQRADDEDFEDELIETALPADQTQFTDFTLEGHRSYFYRVFAVNGNGSSASSEEVRIFTPDSSPTVALTTPAGTPAIFQSGGPNPLAANAIGIGAEIVSAEYQLVWEDAPGTFVAQDVEPEPDQDPYAIGDPLAASPIADTTAVPALPAGAIVELQIYGRVAQAGDAGNGFEWRIGGTSAAPTFIVYESANTLFPRPRRPGVGDAVWITAHRAATAGPLVATRVIFRAPEPQPVAPAAFKLAGLFRGVIQEFEDSFAAPGVSYGGENVLVLNENTNVTVPFRLDADTRPAFEAFVDEGLIPGNAVEVRFWVSPPAQNLPIARQIFPQIQTLDLPPSNPNPTHINHEPVPTGLPPGTQVQFMVLGIITGMDSNLRTWQLGDPEDPIVVYGHALTIPVTDGFRVQPDIGDELIVTARRSVEPGPLIADQILILTDGPGPDFELAETRTQITYLYNGTVTDLGAAEGGVRWTVTTAGVPQQFVMNDPDDPAVIDRGPLPAIGMGTPVTVEFLPPTQVLPEDNWGELALDEGTGLWRALAQLPVVSEAREGTLFVRTTDADGHTRMISLPARLLAGSLAPVAVADAYSVTGTQPLSVAAPGVLGNDDDPEGAPLTAVLEDAPAGVSAFTLHPDGSFDFTWGSNPGASTEVTFTYRASDGVNLSEPATVTVTVEPDPGENLAPVALDDDYTVWVDSFLIHVLVNDQDPDGALDWSSLEVVSQPSNGVSTVVAQSGAIRFDRNGAPAGDTSFTYTVKDDEGATSNVATVTISLRDGSAVSASGGGGGCAQGGAPAEGWALVIGSLVALSVLRRTGERKNRAG